MRRTAVAGLLLACAGCGGTTLVAEPAGTPYDGPMDVAPDFRDRATPLQQAGAAGLALECGTEVFAGGAGDYVDGGLERVQDDPLAAVEDLLAHQSYPAVPHDGYVVERVDGDRALYSYDVDRRTKVAFVVKDGLHDWDDGTGWGVESWGMCDPADLPARLSERLGYQVWTDADGVRLPQGTVMSFAGSAHCDWEDLTYLLLEEHEFGKGREFIGGRADPEVASMQRTTYDADVTLPDDATDTGYRRDGRELWLAADGSAAYLVGPGRTERWPASERPIRCA